MERQKYIKRHGKCQIVHRTKNKGLRVGGPRVLAVLAPYKLVRWDNIQTPLPDHYSRVNSTSCTHIYTSDQIQTWSQFERLTQADSSRHLRKFTRSATGEKRKNSWRERRTAAALPCYRTTTSNRTWTYVKPRLALLAGEQEASNRGISLCKLVIDRWPEYLRAIGK